MGDGLILILADGIWEDGGRLDRLAGRACRTIAADGGFDKATAAGIDVDEVVGDLDSIGPEGKERLVGSDITVHVHPRSKDATDLELAIDLALARRPGKIVIYGGIGGRIDHTLANAFLLLKGIPAGVPIELAGGAETAVAVGGERRLESARIGDPVSLIPISERTVVRTEGLLYRLDGEPLLRGSTRGISNEVSSLPVSVRAEEGVLLLIHREGRPG